MEIKMKLALPSSGIDLNSKIDSQFGRASYFILVDTETMNFEALENSFKSAPQAAGIKVAV
jgi:predicted Fe-Mo cluster-binding NifX family protein